MTLVPENVQDYPRPPRLEPAPARLLARLGGRTIAETDKGLRVLETHHAPSYYFPRADVADVLRPAPGRTICEWKGAASYYDLVTEGATVPRAAWSYASPSPGFAALAGMIAFYAGALDEAFVGDMCVRPQPGDFYGGWVTDNLTGRIKGAPGTRHW